MAAEHAARTVAANWWQRWAALRSAGANSLKQHSPLPTCPLPAVQRPQGRPAVPGSHGGGAGGVPARHAAPARPAAKGGATNPGLLYRPGQPREVLCNRKPVERGELGWHGGCALVQTITGLRSCGCNVHWRRHALPLAPARPTIGISTPHPTPPHPAPSPSCPAHQIPPVFASLPPAQAKSTRDSFLQVFPEVFEALFRLCSDADTNVQNAASFLDNLCKVGGSRGPAWCACCVWCSASFWTTSARCAALHAVPAVHAAPALPAVPATFWTTSASWVVRCNACCACLLCVV